MAIACSRDPKKIGEKSWRRYAEYFHAAGIALHFPNHRYFTDEIFHDSPCNIGPFNPKAATLEMMLENHGITNRIPIRADRKLNLRDFRTRLTFHGVSEIRQPRPISFRLHDDYYSFSEIGRSRNANTLLILTRGSWGKFGWFFVRFQTIEIEDISAKIAKYFQPANLAESDLFGKAVLPGWLEPQSKK